MSVKIIVHTEVPNYAGKHKMMKSIQVELDDEAIRVLVKAIAGGPTRHDTDGYPACENCGKPIVPDKYDLCVDCD